MRCFEKAMKVVKEYIGVNNFFYKVIADHLRQRSEASIISDTSMTRNSYSSDKCLKTFSEIERKWCFSKKPLVYTCCACSRHKDRPASARPEIIKQVKSEEPELYLCKACIEKDKIIERLRKHLELQKEELKILRRYKKVIKNFSRGIASVILIRAKLKEKFKGDLDFYQKFFAVSRWRKLIPLVDTQSQTHYPNQKEKDTQTELCRFKEAETNTHPQTKKLFSEKSSQTPQITKVSLLQKETQTMQASPRNDKSPPKIYFQDDATQTLPVPKLVHNESQTFPTKSAEQATETPPLYEKYEKPESAEKATETIPLCVKPEFAEKATETAPIKKPESAEKATLIEKPETAEKGILIENPPTAEETAQTTKVRFQTLLDFKLFTEINENGFLNFNVKYKGMLTMSYLELGRQLLLEGSCEQIDITPLILDFSEESCYLESDGDPDPISLGEFLRDGVIISEENRIIICKDSLSGFEISGAHEGSVYEKGKDGLLYQSGSRTPLNHFFLEYNDRRREYQYSVLKDKMHVLLRLLLFRVSELDESKRNLLVYDIINKEDIKKIIKKNDFFVIEEEIELIANFLRNYSEPFKICQLLFGLNRGILEIENEIELWVYLEKFEYDFEKYFTPTEIESKIKEINPLIYLMIRSDLPKKCLRLIEIVENIEYLIGRKSNYYPLYEIEGVIYNDPSDFKRNISNDLNIGMRKISVREKSVYEKAGYGEILPEEYFNARPFLVISLEKGLKKRAFINKGLMLRLIFDNDNIDEDLTKGAFEYNKSHLSRVVDPEDPLSDEIISIPSTQEELEIKIKNKLKKYNLGTKDLIDPNLVQEIFEFFFNKKVRERYMLEGKHIAEFARQLCRVPERKFCLDKLYQFVNPRRDIHKYWKLISYLDSKNNVFSGWLNSKEGKFFIKYREFKELLFYSFPNLIRPLAKYMIFRCCRINAEGQASSEEFKKLLKDARAGLPKNLDQELVADEFVPNLCMCRIKQGKIKRKFLYEKIKGWNEEELEHIEILAMIANESCRKDDSLFFVDLMSKDYYNRMLAELALTNAKLIQPDMFQEKITVTNLSFILRILNEKSSDTCMPLLLKLIYGGHVRNIKGLLEKVKGFIKSEEKESVSNSRSMSSVILNRRASDYKEEKLRRSIVKSNIISGGNDFRTVPNFSSSIYASGLEKEELKKSLIVNFPATDPSLIRSIKY